MKPQAILTQVLNAEFEKPNKDGDGHSPINGKCKSLQILPKVWYILDTTDLECDVHIYVSKSVSSIEGSLKSQNGV